MPKCPYRKIVKSCAQMELPEILTEIFERDYCRGDFRSCARFTVIDQVGVAYVSSDLSPLHEPRAAEIIGIFQHQKTQR